MRLVDVDKFLERVKKDREHEVYLHSWTADMVLKRLDSWYAPTVEAIPKDQYEARLKADLEAILVELQLEIEECVDGAEGSSQFEQGVTTARVQVVEIIQQKINALNGLETWHGMNGDITMPEGTFDKIFNDANEDEDDI